ncbi:hypothetical protein [Streptomyces sp. NPDC001568]|uniref:hypothetical protein n=1 Tax=Streptomyces sp. NPDC001568 TaxID=3364588 RepID=UPI0036C9DB1F
MHPSTKYLGDGVQVARPYNHRGVAYASHQERVHGPGGDAVGHLTGREADLMIGRFVRRGGVVRAQRYGALTLTLPNRPGRWVTLTPTSDPWRITGRQYEDMELLAANEHRIRITRDRNGVASIEAGFTRIPPGATRVIRRRGWLHEEPHAEAARISAAGRMAMAFRWAKTNDVLQVLTGLYVDAALEAANNR